MENNEVVTDTVKAEETVSQEKTERMFTRKELNTAIAEEKRKLREELLADIEQQKSEAEKLAKMKDDEKKSYELEKANKRANDAMAELNAYKLEKEAVKIAEEKGVSSKALSLIDFKNTKAEDVETHIETIKNIIDSEVERLVSERMKESTPKTVASVSTQTTELPKFF